ncbi:MAG: phytanoyl-CoA dioxygenase family protein [Pseudomonadota bacterium]
MTESTRYLKKQYEVDGVAFPIPVLSENEAGDHHRRLVDIENSHGSMHYRVKPYLIFSSAYELATNNAVLDAVETVLGPDILLWDSAYIIKEPQTSGFVSWHQDLTYWGLESDSDDDLVTAWLALTPATKQNGCMRFVRASHHGQHFDHQDTRETDNILHRGQTITNRFREADIVSIELRPGEMSLHHGWAIHSSQPNGSTQRRVGLSLQYLKPSVRQIVGSRETATLVRGRDAFGHFESEPACGEDFRQESVEFQKEVERLKREVYDNA